MSLPVRTPTLSRLITSKVDLPGFADKSAVVIGSDRVTGPKTLFPAPFHAIP